MQFLWLIFIYFIIGFSGNSGKRNLAKKNKRNFYVSRIKSLLAPFLIGLGGVMTADWLSDANPLWPALGLASSVAGALFPFWRRPEGGLEAGLAAYCGGVFYLKPVIALTGFGFAMETFLLSKDRVLTAIIFSGVLPVLFGFSQFNPVFFWASVVIQLIFLIDLYNEIKSRIREFFSQD